MKKGNRKYEEKDGENKTATVPARAIKRLNPERKANYQACPACGRKVNPPKGASQITCRWCKTLLKVS